MGQGKTSGKAVKKRPRRTARPRRSARPAVRSGGSSVADLRAQVAALKSELDDAREQQTATSEVLKVISSSPGDLQPVFQAMLENAVRICEANFGVLNRHENGALRVGAMHNLPPTFAEFLTTQDGPFQPIPGSALDRVIRTRQVCHDANQTTGRAATLGGARSTACVPMLKDDELSAPSGSIARRSVPSPKSRSSWCRTSPPRR